MDSREVVTLKEYVERRLEDFKEQVNLQFESIEHARKLALETIADKANRSSVYFSMTVSTVGVILALVAIVISFIK